MSNNTLILPASLQNLELRRQMLPNLPWKRRFLLHLERLMYWSGAAWVYRKTQPVRGVIILMYHSVATPDLAQWIAPNVHLKPEVFEAQIKFLARQRQVISLSEMGSPQDLKELQIKLETRQISNSPRLLIILPTS